MHKIIKKVFTLPESNNKGLEKNKMYLFIPKIIKNKNRI